jgi:hypothetical protein
MSYKTHEMKAQYMPAFANMVLKDHADADVTYTPRDITNGVATAVNTAGVPIGEKIASWATTRTSTGRRKVTLKLAIPVVQDVVVAGISKPTAVRTAYADVTLTFADTSTTTERQEIRKSLIAFLSNAGQVQPMIENLEAPY